MSLKQILLGIALVLCVLILVSVTGSFDPLKVLATSVVVAIVALLIGDRRL